MAHDEFRGKSLPITETGFRAALGTLGVDAPTLWAVMKVEAKSCGFLPDRRPLILFERHKFHEATHGRFDDVAPDLSNATPTPAGRYGTSLEQHEKLARAIRLDRRAALESCSWGLGQIMGFNAERAGFPDVEAMVAAMVDGEDSQLDAMVRFIAGKGLASALRERQWAAFARIYNGAGFRKFAYDEKLAAAHQAYAAAGVPDLRVRAAQLYLTYLGHDPRGIDGEPGRNTAKAIRGFQAAEGLAVTGTLDDATFAALEARATAAPAAGPAPPLDARVVEGDGEPLTSPADLLARARSALGRKIAYELGKGGLKPAAASPADGAGECDCSGYVAWCLGMSRMTEHPLYQAFNGGWINTDAIVHDARRPTGFFEQLNRPRVGCLIVYPSGNGHKVGHVGIVTAVDAGGSVAKVIHCSSGNFRRTGDAVGETGPEVFQSNPGTIFAWYAGIAA